MTSSPATAFPLFPAAPPGAIAPQGASQLRKARIARLRREKPWVTWLAVLLVVGGIAALSVSTVLGGIVLVIAAGAIVITYAVISGRANDEFFAAYAAARGLEDHEGSPVPGGVPLLARGDRRAYGNMLHGPLLNTTGYLGHYTYYVESTDSDGNRTETPHPHTVLYLQLPDQVAQRYPGVYCREKGLFGGGKVLDGVLSDHAVETEYHDFNKRYALRADDRQDDIALFELLSTTFLESLVVDPVFTIGRNHVQWEQVGPHLLLFVPRRLDGSADLDAMVAAAACVYTRYWEEYR